MAAAAQPTGSATHHTDNTRRMRTIELSTTTLVDTAKTLPHSLKNNIEMDGVREAGLFARGDKTPAHQPAMAGAVRCKNQKFCTIVSEQSDQVLSWCKSQVHMFEGDLIGFDKLGAHHEAPRI
jgi:hypothetical protein